MTLPYRCPWCLTYWDRSAILTRDHVLTKHRRALEMALRPVESFTTRKTPDPPRNAAKPYPGTHHTHTSGMPCRCGANAAVSGEGDS